MSHSNDRNSLHREVEPVDGKNTHGTLNSSPVEGNVTNSSGSCSRSSLIGMGFKPSLVDKVIEENGSNDIGFLLEALFAHTSQEQQRSSSDSLDRLFCDDTNSNGDASSPIETTSVICKQEQGGVPDRTNDDKRAILSSMKFTLKEVEFAIEKLGNNAPTHELVDFIFAARMDENCNDRLEGRLHENGENSLHENGETNEILDKRACLLDMGFSEKEISSAIEKFGLEVSIPELADSIFAGQIADSCNTKDEYSQTVSNTMTSLSGNGHGSIGERLENVPKRQFVETFLVKKEKYGSDDFWTVDDGLDGGVKSKSIKQEWDSFDDVSSSYMQSSRLVKRKLDSQNTSTQNRYGMHTFPKSNICRSLDSTIAQPPYFFYGNVVNVTDECWGKISSFLYAIPPEFVDTCIFSALSRKEGYIHNLPTDNRFHISPKSPMKIEDAVPHAREWWPSWDSRKHLGSICADAVEISQACNRLEKILISSHGFLSLEQRSDILHQCCMLNLVWVDKNRLGPIEPENLERLLGYPFHHTRAEGWSLMDRLESLKNSFQTDTLGYHLSGMKSTHPGGIVMLSIFSGIGGAEVALHRLGVHLRGVVSIENDKTKQMILKRWWQATNQTGELVQLEDIQKLTTNRLDSLATKFGGFDFVVCQNPCTYSLKSNKIAANGNNSAGFDFSLFYEFVRVIQRVRSLMGKKR